MKRIIVLLCLVNFLQAGIEVNEDDFKNGVRTPEQKKCEDALKEAMSKDNVKEAAQIFAGTPCKAFFSFFCNRGLRQTNEDVEKLFQATDSQIAQQIASVTPDSILVGANFYTKYASAVVMQEFLRQQRERILSIDEYDSEGVMIRINRDITWGRLINSNQEAYLKVALEERRKIDHATDTRPLFLEGVGATAVFFRNQPAAEILENIMLKHMMEETVCVIDRHVTSREQDKESARLDMQRREETLKQVIRFCGDDFFTKTREREYLYYGNNVDTVTRFDDLLYFQAQQLIAEGNNVLETAQWHVEFLNEIKAMRKFPNGAMVVTVDRLHANTPIITMWQEIIEGLPLEEVVGNVLVPMVSKKRNQCVSEAHDVMGALHDIARCAREYKKAGKMTENIIDGIKKAKSNSSYKRKYDKETYTCIEISPEEQLLIDLIVELEKKD